tara:strand:- start:593 stop:754 length:162 start_codon:yes stop_codon:yes gene_type:complete
MWNGSPTTTIIINNIIIIIVFQVKHTPKTRRGAKENRIVIARRNGLAAKEKER